MPLDLSYLFHATIDLENFNRLLKSSLSKSTNSSYPHYNILKKYFRKKNIYVI